MDYKTTSIRPIKSYPTYQFHACTASEMSADAVFGICILETLNWLRKRLKGFPSLPADIVAPEPENYRDFDADSLHSFNISLGAVIDCTYIKGSGIWSLRITENDSGENPGAANERPAVQGRFFVTEISFVKKTAEGNVEVGVRTICTEPTECTEPCSVFRPAIIRALAKNPDVGFITEGFVLNGGALDITNSSALRNLEKLWDSGSFDMPIVLVADSGYKTDTDDNAGKAVPDASDISISSFIASRLYDLAAASRSDAPAHIPSLSYGENARSYIDKGLALAADRKKEKMEKEAAEKSAPEQEETATAHNKKAAPEKLPLFDVKTLAAKTLGFAVVCFVSESCFERVNNKLNADISAGSIIIFAHRRETARYRYDSGNMDALCEKLVETIKEMSKRGLYSYGSVLFYSDARLADLKERLDQNLTLGEQLGIYKQENAELKASLRALEQQNTDMQVSAENNRTLQKQLNSANSRIDELVVYIDNAKRQAGEKESSYRKAAETISFYRKKAEDAAYFPTDKNDICGWAAENFGSNLVIAPKAENALKKYSGALDTAILCDGLYYLNAYAEYRCGRLDEEMLKLYAESYNWAVQPCGKETLQMRRDDYIVTVDGTQYLLDMHIKYGVSSQSLIRVYFCRDEKSKKVIVGYMPDHLATVSQST